MCPHSSKSLGINLDKLSTTRAFVYISTQGNRGVSILRPTLTARDLWETVTADRDHTRQTTGLAVGDTDPP